MERYNLIRFRKKLGLTQSEFAKLIGLSKQQMCAIETGRTNGKAEAWIELGILFHLEPQELKNLMEVSEWKSIM